MSINFSADEILEVAVDIEKNGQAFYRKAAEVVNDEGAKKLFSELAEWETVHEKIFTAMREKYLQQNIDLSNLDPDGESSLYLQAIADGKLFNPKANAEEMMGGATDPVDILNRALEREKDAVIFFSAMKDMVPQGDDQNDVDKIVKEEMSHVRFIVDKIALFK